MYHDDEDGEDHEESVRGMYDRGEEETDEKPVADTEADGDEGGNDLPDDVDPFAAMQGGTDGDVTPDDGTGESMFDEDYDPERASGLFYVKHVEEESVTFHEVNSGQIFTILGNPGLERHEVVEADLVAQPPMEVSYLVEEIDSQRMIPVEESPEQPTQHVQEVAAEMEAGQATAIDRAGEGEIHILRVETDTVDRTVEELHDDEMTYKNAARYGIDRVEIRSDEAAGTVSIRYLP